MANPSLHRVAFAPVAIVLLAGACEPVPVLTDTHRDSEGSEVHEPPPGDVVADTEDSADVAPAPDGITPDPVGLDLHEALDAEVDTLPDLGSPDTGPTDAPTLLDALEPHRWSRVEVPGAVCGNGSTAAIGVNPGRSDEVLVFLQGGGICWDWNTCFVLRSAANIDVHMGEARLMGQIRSSGSVLFERDAEDNPFAEATWIFIPYCTGDLFAGDTETTHSFLLESRTVHHRGARNWDFILPLLKEALPDIQKLWLYGTSAGGFGVTLNWWRFIDAFPEVPVLALNDCGTPIAPTPARWREWRDATGLTFPPGCTDCADSLANLLPHYAGTIGAPHRYGLLAYEGDLVLQLYMNLDHASLVGRTRALRQKMHDTEVHNQRTYLVDDNAHVMFGRLPFTHTHDGTTALAWVRAWADPDATWEDAGP